MHRLRGLSLALLVVSTVAAAGAGCAGIGHKHVDGGVLGRVVIYRNGVAFYERSARVADGRVTVRVPRDKVDDFLKSLTVVDRTSRKPLAVTIPRREAEDGSYLTMTLETQDLANADVLITYVTEAPAWKPSYRIVVAPGGDVMLEAWAIVDNTTTEDWNKVLVGVGASSALAFRYDLWSVRQVDRDLLAGEQRFAIAPPTGVSPYQESTGGGAEELASLDAQELRSASATESLAGTTSVENTYLVEGVNTASRTTGNASGATGSISGVVKDKRTGEALAGVTIVVAGRPDAGEQTVISDEYGRYTVPGLAAGTYRLTYYYGDVSIDRPSVAVANGKETSIVQALTAGEMHGETIMIQGTAPIIDRGSTKASTTITDVYSHSIPTGRTFGAVLGSAAGSSGSSSESSASKAPPPPPPVRQGDDKLKAIAAKVLRDKRDVVVEVYGRPGSEKQLAERGTAVKNKLVNDGVPATRVRIVPKVAEGQADNVRVFAVAPQGKAGAGAPPSATSHGSLEDAPVGESHFIADRPMTVRAGSSAMVAMLHGKTKGGVVYLYDPISERGDQHFAFKAVRLENPTMDTLEPGPVTVYGDGRFIGEGITDPVPPKSSVVIPFALDRQIVVSRNGHEEDRIAKLLTASRGVISAEVQHRRNTRFTVTSRLATPTTVYLRHKLADGWTLVDAPKQRTRVGDTELLEVPLGPGETKYIDLAEATPVERTFDLAAPAALGMMKVYIEEPDASPQLKAQVAALLATHRGAADLVDKIETLRGQIGEYRSRSGELHAQLVTLKAVRTGGELMASLRQRMAEMSDRVQKATIELVDTQEKLMLARVKFQNQLADLKLTDATKPPLAIGT